MNEIFPWDFLDCGVTKEFLLREWKKAMKEEVSLNWAAQCQGCGAAKYGVGICTQEKGGNLNARLRHPRTSVPSRRFIRRV